MFADGSLNTYEMAKMLDVSYQTVVNYVDAGIIHPYMYDRHCGFGSDSIVEGLLHQAKVSENGKVALFFIANNQEELDMFADAVKQKYEGMINFSEFKTKLKLMVLNMSTYCNKFDALEVINMCKKKIEKEMNSKIEAVKKKADYKEDDIMYKAVISNIKIKYSLSADGSSCGSEMKRILDWERINLFGKSMIKVIRDNIGSSNSYYALSSYLHEDSREFYAKLFKDILQTYNSKRFFRIEIYGVHNLPKEMLPALDAFCALDMVTIV